MIGHLVGAAGIASALAAIGAIRDQVIPPTANLHTPDPECDLDYVPLTARRKAKVDTVAVNGFGFGGQNAVAIFRRIEPLSRDWESSGADDQRPDHARLGVARDRQAIRYVPGRRDRKRIRCVWPGRAAASMLASPSTIQSWKTGSSLLNWTTTTAPAPDRRRRRVRSEGRVP